MEEAQRINIEDIRGAKESNGFVVYVGDLVEKADKIVANEDGEMERTMVEIYNKYPHRVLEIIEALEAKTEKAKAMETIIRFLKVMDEEHIVPHITDVVDEKYELENAA